MNRRLYGLDLFSGIGGNTLDGIAPRSQEAIQRQFATARKGRTAPANLREWIHAEM